MATPTEKETQLRQLAEKVIRTLRREADRVGPLGGAVLSSGETMALAEMIERELRSITSQ